MIISCILVFKLTLKSILLNEILKQKRDAVYLSNSDSISCAHGIVGHIA